MLLDFSYNVILECDGIGLKMEVVNDLDHEP